MWQFADSLYKWQQSLHFFTISLRIIWYCCFKLIMNYIRYECCNEQTIAHISLPITIFLTRMRWLSNLSFSYLTNKHHDCAHGYVTTNLQIIICSWYQPHPWCTWKLLHTLIISKTIMGVTHVLSNSFKHFCWIVSRLFLYKEPPK